MTEKEQVKELLKELARLRGLENQMLDEIWEIVR